MAATATPTPPPTSAEEAERLCREMAQIRLELHRDVRGAVQATRAWTDINSYVRSAPWLSVGVAFVVGYLVVPRKRPQTVATAVEKIRETIPEVAAQAAKAARKAVKPAKPKSSGLFGSLWGLVAPMATRFAKDYAVQAMTQWATDKGFIPPPEPAPAPVPPGPMPPPSPSPGPYRPPGATRPGSPS